VLHDRQRLRQLRAVRRPRNPSESEGRAWPFEVWVNGAEQPRGLGAIAKTLSMDMRANDRGWLKLKLDTLAKTRGDDSCSIRLPAEWRIAPDAQHGRRRRAIAALAPGRPERARR
jgi:hypothetical protein